MEGTVFCLSKPNRISIHVLTSSWPYRKLCAEELESNTKELAFCMVHVPWFGGFFFKSKVLQIITFDMSKSLIY